VRILQILHGEALGGMEKFCIELTNALAEYNEVFFLVNSKLQEGISSKVHIIEFGSDIKKNNPYHLYRVYKLIQSIKPDIIHAHKQKGIYIIKRLYPLLKIPYVATKHDTFQKKVFNKIPHVIAVSDAVKKTFCAPNVYKIETAIKKIQIENIQKNKVFTIIAVGGLRPVKGFDVLIASCANLPFNFKLIIVGEGEERTKLEDLIAKLGLQEKIELLGFRTDVPELLSKAHLQVISSHSEGFSLAMIEGIFYSDVLISTPVSGCVEVLPEIFLTNQKDIYNKIIDIYNNYKFYKDAFTIVKKKNEKNFDIKNCALKHEEVYEKIIKS
jgi:glycosyltransferase involved in cell wall biosynthesis